MAYIDKVQAQTRLRTECVQKYPASFASGLLAAAAELDKLPTADVTKVTHEHWIENEDDFWVMCSGCGVELLDDQIRIVNKYKHCPLCGAKMDGEGEEQK